ncbi:MAG: hypothetical protein KME13_25510 [Myxacorys californica WJT36-NPBG1]|jgi:hypothetical protein|nr:hypothetical protein [Myxacorys californica WJT36-NPBG1]
MNQPVASFKRVFALGISFVLVSSNLANANTPRGTSGINTGSEVAPRNLTPHPGIPTSLYNEVIGELRAVLSERAVPPNEPNVQPERSGFVRLDLKRADSVPSNIVTRFTSYVLYLNAQPGQFDVFGSDLTGISRDVKFALIPKLNRQIEIRFISTSGAGKPGSQPSTQTIIAPNAKVAAALVGVLTALDVSGASPTSVKAAIAMLTSLGDVKLSNPEVIGLAQSLTETLIASEGLAAGCGGRVGSSFTCPNLNVNQLSAAIRAYNQIVEKSNDPILISLSNNAEFQALGANLRLLKAEIAPKIAQ